MIEGLYRINNNLLDSNQIESNINNIRTNINNQFEFDNFHQNQNNENQSLSQNKNIKKKEEPKKTSFFGKVENIFSKAKSSVKEVSNDLLQFLPDRQKLSEQAKNAAIGFNQFGQDVSNDFKVK